MMKNSPTRGIERAGSGIPLPGVFSSDWPVLPLLAAIVAGALANASLLSSAWLADFLALLAGFSILQIATAAIRKPGRSLTPQIHWALLACASVAALLAAIYLQGFFWPAARAVHRDWLLPLVLSGFLLVFVVPAEISRELTRRASRVLAAEQARHMAERQILEARLAALQGQIEPHFLYNTLANAKALIRQDAVAAETMLSHLIAYLRAAMPDMRASTTTLGQELLRAETFLEIIKLRFGERLRFHIAAEPEAQLCQIPPLALMTLVENAIKHGIEPKPAGGMVSITATVNEGVLVIAVVDDGAGFQSEIGNGIGLLNLQERLQATFGPVAELVLSPGVSCGVVAKLVLPAKAGGSLQ